MDGLTDSTAWLSTVKCAACRHLHASSVTRLDAQIAAYERLRRWLARGFWALQVSHVLLAVAYWSRPVVDLTVLLTLLDTITAKALDHWLRARIDAVRLAQIILAMHEIEPCTHLDRVN